MTRRSSLLAFVFAAAALSEAWGMEVVQNLDIGHGPAYVQVTPNSAKAYVTLRDADAVAVVDLAVSPHALLRTVQVPDGPAGLAMKPDGTEVWVASRLAGKVTVIATATDTVTDVIDVGPLSSFIRFDAHAEFAYVSLETTTSSPDQQFKRIHVDPPHVVETFLSTAPDTAQTVCFAPGGSVGYFGLGNNTPPAIHTNVVDLSTRETLASIPEFVPELVSRDGTRLWVRDFFGHRIAAFDVSNPAAPSLLWTLTVPPRPNTLALDPSEAILYVTSDTSHALTSIGACDGTLLETIQVGHMASGLALSERRCEGYVANLNDDTLSVVSMNRTCDRRDRGPVAYWPFDQSYRDESGNGHHGEPHGSPGFEGAEVGSGLVLDGLTQHVAVGPACALDLQSHSISVWVKWHPGGNNAESAIYMNGESADRLGLVAGAGAIHHVIDYPTNLPHTVITPVLANEALHHLAATWDGKASQVWIDGRPTPPESIEATIVYPASETVFIGHSPYGGPDRFRGVLDELRIFDRALTPTEIVCLASPTQDSDLDGRCGEQDNCPAVSNPDQADADNDGLGDVCDPCTDRDGDGYGQPGNSTCPGGGLTDCDDLDSDSHPGATEICDNRDNDCDALVDEGDPGGGSNCNTGEVGNCAAGTEHCSAGVVQCIRNLGPGPELCNGLDDDCDGTVDEVADSDGDDITDCLDNCPTVHNPAQADADNDQIGDPCDCWPDDASNPGAPEVVALFVSASDPFALQWSTPSANVRFNVYRGYRTTGNPWSYDHQCVANHVTASSALDPLAPLPATFFYYLVSSVCPNGNESYLGRDSGGTPIERPALATDRCPNPIYDTDGDGIVEALDNCPGFLDSTQSDVDGDSHGDSCDNCPAAPNTEQMNTDGDDYGDACDPDDDDDGIPDDGDLNGVNGDHPCAAGEVADCDDNCPVTSNPAQEDSNGDGVGDACQAKRRSQV